MKFGRFAGAALCLAAIPYAACARRRAAEINDIVPSVTINRPRAPLGSAIEVTYNWKLEPTAKKLGQEYRAFVHVLDTHGVILFGDDHVPVPPAATWEPGRDYSYTRTVFIPIYPYVGEAEIRVGLFPVPKGERLAMKGDDAGLREYRVGKMELLPQTENIFLVYKDGWHNPETSPHNPAQERTWTKKDAVVSFKNPRKDILIYLEADTNSKAFDVPPVLTVSLNGKTGLVVPIENSEVFLKKIRVKAADLGDQEWVDLRLSMNQSFVPKLKDVNSHDDRELGLLVYHLYVADAGRLGQVAGIVDAGPVAAPPVVATAATARRTAPTKAPAPAKPLATPAPTRPPAKPTTAQ